MTLRNDRFLTFTVRRLMIVVAVSAVVFSLSMVVIQFNRHVERIGLEGGCYSSLNNIAMALNFYHEAHGRFPPPFAVDQHGSTTHSWRALILPWLQPANDPVANYYDPSERWDGVRNASLSSRVPGWLHCPLQRGENSPGSPFVMINDFSDPTIAAIPGNAILVLEAWGANRNWADPTNHFASSPQVAAGATDHPGGFGVILYDLSVVRVRDPSRIVKNGGYYTLN